MISVGLSGRAEGNPVRARLVDGGIAVGAQLAVTMPFVVPRDPAAPPASWTAYGFTTLGVLPLLWRSRAPFAVLGAVAAAQFLYEFAMDGPGQPLPYAGAIAVYTVAVLSPLWQRVVTIAAGVPTIAYGVSINTGQARELLFSLIVFFGAHALGTLTRTRQDYAEAAERRAAEQAAERERVRIAREIHDVLSHSVALMLVQAEAGPVAVRAAPERAEAAFDAIADTGREAMAQLRRMLGVLREDGDRSRSPQPAVAGLPALVERVSGRGLQVSYDMAGRVRPLPLDVETTVYRVVQEALTNVVKHAGASRAAVLLDYGRTELGITVTDDGRGPADDSVTGPGGGAPATGHGLVGIHERAAAHGGRARTGPGPDGRGFELSVTLEVAR